MSELLDQVKAAMKEELGNVPWTRIERAAVKAIAIVQGTQPSPMPRLSEQEKPNFRKGLA